MSDMPFAGNYPLARNYKEMQKRVSSAQISLRQFCVLFTQMQQAKQQNIRSDLEKRCRC